MTGPSTAPLPPVVPLRVALVSQCPEIPADELARVAAALHTQVTRDLLPHWGIQASVEALPDPARIPADILPVFIRPDTPNHVGGLHTNAGNGRPFAVVLVSRDWHLAASHECLELLIDPTGNRLQPGRELVLQDGTLQDGPGQVRYVVEACDPLEDPSCGYDIDGIRVADFYTQAYFDDAPSPGKRYSHAGSLTRPREVRPDGYLSWLPPEGTPGPIRQLRCFGDPAILDLPDHTSATAQFGLSHREFIDRHTITPRQRRR